jgi:hypothetical protein
MFVPFESPSSKQKNALNTSYIQQSKHTPPDSQNVNTIHYMYQRKIQSPIAHIFYPLESCRQPCKPPNLPNPLIPPSPKPWPPGAPLPYAPPPLLLLLWLCTCPCPPPNKVANRSLTVLARSLTSRSGSDSRTLAASSKPRFRSKWARSRVAASSLESSTQRRLWRHQAHEARISRLGCERMGRRCCMREVWEMRRERCAGRPLARWTRTKVVAKTSSKGG